MNLLRSRASLIAVLLTVALLPALAALQYRWLGTLSELEHRRMRSNLYRDAERFCESVDFDLTRIYSEFQSHLGDRAEPERQLAEAYSEWAGSVSHSGLVKAVHWITPSHNHGLDFQMLELSQGQLVSSDPPDWMTSVEHELTEYFAARRDNHRTRESRSRSRTELDPLIPDVPALLVADERRGSGVVAVTLDREVLLHQVFFERIRYFTTGEELAYDVLIVDASRPENVIYRSSAELTTRDFTDPDEEEFF